MRLGETRLFRGWSQQMDEEIEALVESAVYCSRRKIGTLIAIEREVGLGGIAESGTRVNADCRRRCSIRFSSRIRNYTTLGW